VLPVICLITDRRRLGGEPETALIEQVTAAARAGVHLIQIRERDLDAASLTAIAARAVQAVRGTSSRVLINDRIDVALAVGAHGVHLRGDSVPAWRARRIVPGGFLLGRSVHSLAEASRMTEAGGLDYLLFGNVFETTSKPDLAGAGASTLSAIARATPLPVLAVGGITVERMDSVARAGASGFAAIGLFADCSSDRLQVVVTQASLAFDTPLRVP
jgi:thiamine-phosphate pyrophosphorylase